MWFIVVIRLEEKWLGKRKWVELMQEDSGESTDKFYESRHQRDDGWTPYNSEDIKQQEYSKDNKSRL